MIMTFFHCFIYMFAFKNLDLNKPIYSKLTIKTPPKFTRPKWNTQIG